MPPADLHAALLDALSRAGVQAQVQADACLVDGRTYRLQVRHVMPALARILEPLKSHAVDVERHLAGQPAIGGPEDPASVLLVLAVPRLPDLALPLGRLAAEPAWAAAAWAVLSARGGFHLALPGHPRPLSAPDDEARPTEAATPDDAVGRDLPAALLGLLLLQRARPSRLRHPPACLGIESLGEAATALGVHRAAVYAAAASLEEQGLITTRHGRLPVIRDLPVAVNRCLDRAKHRPQRAVAVAPLIGAWRDREAAVAGMHACAGRIGTADWAITGWEACQRHGLGVLTSLASKPLEIVTRLPVDEALRRLELRRATDGQASALLLRTPTPRAVFLGAAVLPGAPAAVVDPWQAALHTAADRQRGIEQATAIADSLWAED